MLSEIELIKKEIEHLKYELNLLDSPSRKSQKTEIKEIRERIDELETRLQLHRTINTDISQDLKFGENPFKESHK
jgi:hypothetical protein